MKTFKNPILPGFYPDPSICRVGEDYYLVNSTFAYFPGVPIWHSRDLVHWEQIGHVLDRESQLPLEGIYHSGGIYAPTIRYHEGTFYMITTNVGGIGNFYVTATDPAGPWSDPVVLEDAEGIDPSLFFDDDGKVYYIGTKGKEESVSRYWGDNVIYVRELDLAQGKLVGEEYVVWEGAYRETVWAEGPHLYKKDGYYYVMISEGGTGHEHALTIARSKEIMGSYESYICNPILTHRHLGSRNIIQNTGHGDLVQTQNGDWWMVLLGSRPYEGYYNMGRETFLVPVTWEDGWPVVNDGKGIVEEEGIAPNLPEFEVMPEDVCEQFMGDALDYKWISLRGPKESFCSLKDRKGYLRLQLRPETIKEFTVPSFVARRQQHKDFNVNTMMEFVPQNENEVAGLVLMQNDGYHFRFEYIMEGQKTYLRLTKCEKGQDEIINEVPFEGNKVYMRVIAKGQHLDFYYGTHSSKVSKLAENVDATILSTNKAEGFVGTCIGMYASSNGKASQNYADFNWFEYSGR